MDYPPPSLDQLIEARQRIALAIRYLRDGRRDEFHLIEPTLSFESGALHALDWVIGLSGAIYFERHLNALDTVAHRLTRLKKHDGGTKPG